MGDPVVVLAADGNFCKQLAVTVASIAQVATGQRYQVFVLHDGYTDDLQAKIAGVAGAEIDLHWFSATDTSVERGLLPTDLPPATVFRLRIADLLPASIDRALYLDADTIVRHPLTPLWETDLDGHLVGAVRDSWLWWFARGLPWRDLGVNPGLPYLNAGVLLLPLDAWRDRKLSQVALDLMARHRFADGDQGAVNMAVAGDWLHLDPRWNLQGTHLTGDDAGIRALEDPAVLDAAIADPAVVHLCRSHWTRPWEPGCEHPFRDEWFALLDTTPWAGWRPEEPSRTTRIAQRTKLAAATLVRGQ